MYLVSLEPDMRGEYLRQFICVQGVVGRQQVAAAAGVVTTVTLTSSAIRKVIIQ
jgi:hypothetical protein